MKDNYRTATIFLVIGLIVLELAYLTFTGTQPVTFRNAQGEVTGVADLTTLFTVVSWSALTIGLCLVLMAIRSVFGTSEKEPSSSTMSVATKRLLGNPRVWLAFNVLLIPFSVLTGYEGLVSSKVGEAGLDYRLCGTILIMMPLFVVASVRFAAVRPFRKPTWDRFPFNWRGDPLQSLFVASGCSLAIVVGSLLRLFESGMAAIGSVSVSASIFVGLVLGQILVYWMYRKQPNWL